MMRRTPLKRKANLKQRSPLRSARVPAKPKRASAPGRDFWETQRLVIYNRARGLCEHCGAPLDVTGLEAHHRKFRSRGGGHGVENLAALCPESHRWAHSQGVEATELGFALPTQSNPCNRAMVLFDGRTVRLNTDGTYDTCWESEEEEVA